MPDFNACGPFMDFQAKRMLDQDSVEFRPVRSETRSFWEEDPTKITTKTCSSDGQELVVISRVRTVSTQGERKSVVIGGGDPVGGFFAWSVLHCRGQRCDAGSGSLLVGW